MDSHIRLILMTAAGQNPPLSPGQMVMVGLALDQPEMLFKVGVSNVPDAWQRLDDEQCKAVLMFRGMA